MTTNINGANVHIAQESTMSADDIASYLLDHKTEFPGDFSVKFAIAIFQKVSDMIEDDPLYSTDYGANLKKMIPVFNSIAKYVLFPDLNDPGLPPLMELLVRVSNSCLSSTRVSTHARIVDKAEEISERLCVGDKKDYKEVCRIYLETMNSCYIIVDQVGVRMRLNGGKSEDDRIKKVSKKVGEMIMKGEMKFDYLSA
jgi:hypothetical protein